MYIFTLGIYFNVLIEQEAALLTKERDQEDSDSWEDLKWVLNTPKLG